MADQHPVRRTRLRVIDEVANGLVLLRLHLPARVAALLRRRSKPSLPPKAIAVDGDAAVVPAHGELDRRRSRRQSVRHRDGAARRRCTAQSGRAIGHYLDELHLLGGELSLDGRLVDVSESWRCWPPRSPDRSANREHEPYRRAITGIYARLAATARGARPAATAAASGRRRAALSESGELLADLAVIDRSLTANGSAAWSRPAGCGRCGAPSTCSAFISRRSTCAKTPMCMSGWWASCSGLAQPGLGYAALGESERVRLLLNELGTARPLASPYLGLFGGDPQRAGDPARGRRSPSPLRPRARCRTT